MTQHIPLFCRAPEPRDPLLGLTRATARTLERIGTVRPINRRPETAAAPTSGRLSFAGGVASTTPIGQASAARIPASNCSSLQRLVIDAIRGWECRCGSADGGEEAKDELEVHCNGGALKSKLAGSRVSYKFSRASVFQDLLEKWLWG